MAREKIYTREGDDGTTGLFYGGRVPKDSELPRAYGAVDEAQAVIGLVRVAAGHGSEVDSIVVPIMRDQAKGAMAFERTPNFAMSSAIDLESPTMPILAAE